MRASNKKATKTTKRKRSKPVSSAKDEKTAALEQEKRLGLVPELPVVTPVVKSEGITHYRKCKFPSCRRLVDEQGFPPYCTFVCRVFDQRRINALAGLGNMYKPEYAGEEICDYLKECEVSHGNKFMKIGESTMVPVKNAQIPSIAGYALFLGYNKMTLRLWATKHDEFRIALLILKEVQESFLLSKGLTNMYNPVVTKLMLMNNHGMKDRSEKTVNHLFGIVREAYEQADAYDQDGQDGDAFNDENDNATLDS